MRGRRMNAFIYQYTRPCLSFLVVLTHSIVLLFLYVGFIKVDRNNGVIFFNNCESMRKRDRGQILDPMSKVVISSSGVPKVLLPKMPREDNLASPLNSYRYHVPSTYHSDVRHKTVHTFGNTIWGSLFMDKVKNDDASVMSDFDLFATEINMTCHLKPRLCPILTQRPCSWCIDASETGKIECIEGLFEWNNNDAGFKMEKNELTMFHNLQYQFNLRKPINLRHHHYKLYTEILFRCKFPQTLLVGVPGSLLIPWVKNSTFTQKQISDEIIPTMAFKRQNLDDTMSDSIRTTAVKPNSCVVCGRGLHGPVSGDAIVQQVEYYKYQGLNGVILYDLGISSIDKHYLLEDYISDGSLILIDLRDFLQELYGIHAVNILLRSFAVGQMWVKYDCAIRARHLGYEWALHVDLDEYLIEGNKRLERFSEAGSNDDSPFSLAHFVKEANRKRWNWVSFGSLRNPSDQTLCGDKYGFRTTNQIHSSGDFRYDWKTWLRRAHSLHADVECKNASQFFVHNFGRTSSKRNRCKEYNVCRGSSGLRKILAKTSLNPLSLKTHSISRDIRNAVNGIDIPVDEMYIRHYACINKILPQFSQLRNNKTEFAKW